MTTAISTASVRYSDVATVNAAIRYGRGPQYYTNHTKPELRVDENHKVQGISDSFHICTLGIPMGAYKEQLVRVTKKSNNTGVVSRWNTYWNPSADELAASTCFVYIGPTPDEMSKFLKLKPAATKMKVKHFQLVTGKYAYHPYGYYRSLAYGYSKEAWYCLVVFDKDGMDIPVVMLVPVAEKVLGMSVAGADDKGLTLSLESGLEVSLTSADLALIATSTNQYTNNAVVFTLFSDTKIQDAILRSYMKSNKGKHESVALKGIQKTWKNINPLAEQLADKHPRHFLAYRALAAACHRTIDKVKASTVFNRTFKDVTTEEEFVKAMEPMLGIGASAASGRGMDFANKIVDMPAYKEHRKTVLKKQTKRAHAKLMEDVEFLKIDEKQFPLTSKAVEDGDLPLRTFFSKKEQYFIYNDNWALWEEMLTHHREEALKLAKEVSTRTSYDKDLMSYFYFVLYGLPEYLEKFTGKKWKGIPKLVNDSSALDSSSMADGVTSERSAMTPVADNDKCTVTVPFISVYMPGRFGVYCYAHNYCVLHRGFQWDGNAVLKDVEEKLNGKDDYGLMFYTLIGTDRGTGYPTFLIIFEKLSSGTKVHIHRVNPSRSKDGDSNPVHNWTKNCYNWMAGNVRRDRIKTSQGDLMFVEIEDEVKRTFTAEVNNFDSHRFDKPVGFCKDVPKNQKNLLGYVTLQDDTWLRHPEHEDRLLKQGAYEIRQARSFEASPAGSWSLTID